MGDAPLHAGAGNDLPQCQEQYNSGDNSVDRQKVHPQLQQRQRQQQDHHQYRHQQQHHHQFQHHHHHQHQHQHQHAFAFRYDMAQQQQQQQQQQHQQLQQTLGRGQTGPYNMNSMMHALPNHHYRSAQEPWQQQQQQQQHQQQQYHNALDSAGNGQVMSQAYGGASLVNSIHHVPHYYMSLQQHDPSPPHYYGQQQMQEQHHGGSMSPKPVTTYYQQPPRQDHHQQYYYPQGGHQYAGPGQMVQTASILPGHYAQTGTSMPQQHVDHRLLQPQTPGDPAVSGVAFQSQGRIDDGAKSITSQSGVVRGPPRKPRQSGHAIWIGNLPPQADLMSLVSHVCKEAPGLESLFLISKSNCAFANFRDEQACVSAQQKLHDSKFQSVRLVSRLRKSTVEGATGLTAPTGPSSTTPQSNTSQEHATGDTAVREDGADPLPTLSPEKVTSPTLNGIGSPPSENSSAPPQKERYFILKSLTVEDLEQSIKTGIWATQAHNEKALSKAYKTSQSVYLVFSANKSGEYFGYGRMASPINNDPAAAIEFAPQMQAASDAGLPKAIPTEGNEYMPRGSIMDDSERGTIFWEAELPDEDVEEEDETTVAAAAADGGTEETETKGGATVTTTTKVMDEDAENNTSGVHTGAEGDTKTWGKPFQIEWISTTRLPFYRTRGIRNPWNSNREVKIARDGTELEPSVGRRLTGLFAPPQQPQPPRGVAYGHHQHHQHPRMPVGMPVVPGGGMVMVHGYLGHGRQPYHQ